MKRRFEICKKCSCLRHLTKSDVGSWYCFHEALIDSNGEEIGVGWNDLHWRHNWNKADVPEECELYAEYFIEECNK